MNRSEQRKRAIQVMQIAIEYYEEMMDNASIDKYSLDDKETTLLVHCIRQVNTSWLKQAGYANHHELDRVSETLAIDLMSIVERQLHDRSKDV